MQTQSCVLEFWLHLPCVRLCHKIVLHVLKNLKSKIPLKCGWLSSGTGEGGVFQRAATVLTGPGSCQSLQWVGDASGWTSSSFHRGRCIPRERIWPLHQNHFFKAQRFKIQNPTYQSIKLATFAYFSKPDFKADSYLMLMTMNILLLEKFMTTIWQNTILMCPVIMPSEFIFPEYSYHRIIQGILIIFKILFKIFFKSKQS